MMSRGDASEYANIYAGVCMRGIDVPPHEEVKQILLRSIEGGGGRSSAYRWGRSSSNLFVSTSKGSVNGYTRAVSAMVNGKGILPLLHRVYDKALLLYDVRAYIHQYSVHGVHEEDFETSFNVLGNIINDYENL
jgi:hypothetical protein